MTDKKGLGSFIREKRIAKGYTQEQLAALLFVKESAVSKWERGVNYPDITLLRALCQVLGVNEHELLTSSNDTEYRKMRRESTLYRRITTGSFYFFVAAYALALIICLIVDLAVNHTLTWFPLVLTAILTAFSFMPTCLRFVKKHRLLVFLGTTFSALFLLFMTCSLYTGTYWFGIAIMGVFLSYTALFLPLILKTYLPVKFNRFKLLIYFTSLLIGSLALLATINAFVQYELFAACMTTLYCFIPFLVLSLVHLANISKSLKAGIDVLVFGVDLYGVNYIISCCLGHYLQDSDPYQINFGDWTTYNNGNIAVILLAAVGLVGSVLIIRGLIKSKTTATAEER